MTPVSLDAQRLGMLLLVDPETGAEARIDDHVAGFSLDSAREAEEGIIMVSIVEEGAEVPTTSRDPQG